MRILVPIPGDPAQTPLQCLYRLTRHQVQRSSLPANAWKLPLPPFSVVDLWECRSWDDMSLFQKDERRGPTSESKVRIGLAGIITVSKERLVRGESSVE